jgi:small subunit ribosomal protein S19
MTRSIWKGNFISKSLLRSSFEKKIQKDIENKRTYKIWNRNSCIPYFLVNKTVLVHTGKEFKQIFINRGKVGFKFGEFAYTRTLKKKIQKKAKIKKKPNVITKR